MTTRLDLLAASFEERIRKMNLMYGLPFNLYPTHYPREPLVNRVRKFGVVLEKEVSEGRDIEELAEANAPEIDQLVAVADWLGDVVVYCYSESAKYGLPMASVLRIIMDSNDSKLGADGLPIIDPKTGKFEKGPNYWKPEPKIKALLLQCQEEGMLPNTTDHINKE